MEQTQEARNREQMEAWVGAAAARNDGSVLRSAGWALGSGQLWCEDGSSIGEALLWAEMPEVRYGDSMGIGSVLRKMMISERTRIEGAGRGGRMVSKMIAPQQKAERRGSIRRFLQWLARGADGSRTIGTSCPT